MSTTNTNTEWIPQQIKVFSRWVSSHLSEGNSDVQVNDVTKDLSNGVALIELAQILTGKEAPRNWSHDPKHNAQMVTNSDMAIDMFTKDGVHFVGISGKDIHDSKEKLVLGLVWTLILRYSIGQSIDHDNKVNTTSTVSSTSASKSNKDALMQWAIDRTENYPNIKNFQPYDLSMCALLDSYAPEKINYYSLDPKDSQHNAELATNVMKELGIPAFLDSDDLQETTVDQKALLTQLSTAKTSLERLPPPPPPQPAAPAPSSSVETHVDEVSFNTVNTEEIVSNFNESSVTNEEVGLNEGEITQHTIDSDENILESVGAFNQSDQTFEEIIDDAISSEDVAERNQAFLSPIANQIDSESETESDEQLEVQTRDVETEFVPHQVEGDNSQYSGRKFGLIMTINETDYNNGEKMNTENDQLLFGEDIQLALTLTKDENPYLNPAGRMLDVVEPNVANDPYQQFTFGLNEWNTVIDSFVRKGMVWDVADQDNTNPPAGTPFYVFPFHGRHNQHFVYKDGMIYAKQNGHVVTYVGGDQPLVMMPPSNALRARQTFTIQLI